MTVQRHLRALAIAASLAAIGANVHAADMATSTATAKPSVVIVHGAFADGSDWARVIPLLQAKGVKVTAAP